MRLLSGIFLLALTLSARAENWTTTDGKIYRQIKVIKVDDDAVTILDSDGGALVPLASLPPALQREFHFDAARAQAAASRRQADDDASQAALQQQKTAQVGAGKIQVAQASPAPAAAPVAGVPSAAPSSQAAPPASQFALNKGDAGTASGNHDRISPNWKLVWSDDFDGPEIDPSKWNFEIDGKGGGNGEMEYYTAKSQNAHIEDGHLLITAIRDGTDAEGNKHQFTSARLTTKGKFSAKYGRFEARIKVPTGRGVWPAFWLMPEDDVYGGWASSGELDILEEVGDKPDTLFGTIHYGDKWPGNTHTGDKYVLPAGILADDWHVYAVEWEEGVIRWYLDGKLYQTQTKWYTKAAPFPAPFDQKFFIILNFAVGGAWPGPPSADTKFPQSMDVDYVRVYQP